MIGLHVTSIYDLPMYSREELERQTDALEAALIELEETDPSVTDSTVSVNFGTGRVQIEVFTTAQDVEEAERAAVRRTREAVARMMNTYKVEEHTERVPA